MTIIHTIKHSIVGRDLVPLLFHQKKKVWPLMIYINLKIIGRFLYKKFKFVIRFF